MPPKTANGPVQARLNFHATKPSGAAPTGKSQKGSVTKPTSQPQLIKPAHEERAIEKTSTPKKRKPAASDSEYDEDEEVEEEDRSFEQLQPSDEEEITGAAVPAVTAKKVEVVEELVVSSSEDEEPVVQSKAAGKQKEKARSAPPSPKKLKDLEKSKAFKDAHKEAKADAGDLVGSGKDDTKAQIILRNFDLTYDFGPCVGISRLERWERAERLGKEPPEIVRQILETEKADKMTDEQLEVLRNPVFSGMV